MQGLVEEISLHLEATREFGVERAQLLDRGDGITCDLEQRFPAGFVRFQESEFHRRDYCVDIALSEVGDNTRD